MPGVAVEYQEDDTGEKHWLVIEDSPQPNASRDEHGPDEPICAALMKKAKGEKFALREHPARTAMVLDMANKYVFRFRHCLSNMETRFSGRANVLEFRVPKKTDGTPDISTFVEQLKEIGGRQDKVLTAYREKLIPLHMVATVRGVTVYQVAQEVAYDANTRIRCCLGNEQERETSLQSMRTSNAFVLDVTALSTLALLEAQGICKVRTLLESLPCKVVVSEHVLLDLRKLQDLRFGADREQMFVGTEAGRLYQHKVPADQMREAREQIQGLIDTMRDVCLIEQGTDLARHLRDKEDWLSILGPAGFHSMLLAAKPGRVLWTDDWTAGQVAANRLSVNQTWTHAVLLWLELTGRVSKDLQEQATLVLIRAGYVFTGINHEHVLLAIEQANWDVDSPRLAPVLEHFADGSVEPSNRLALASASLKAIWQRGLIVSHTTALTIRILNLLASDRAGRAIVDALLHSADRVFGIDVINAEGFKQAIAAWKATRGRIIRP
jgi:hypothetical protein